MVLGLDPAYRTGCKLAVIDPTGKVTDIDVIYPINLLELVRAVKQQRSLKKLLKILGLK